MKDVINVTKHKFSQLKLHLQVQGNKREREKVSKAKADTKFKVEISKYQVLEVIQLFPVVQCGLVFCDSYGFTKTDIDGVSVFVKYFHGYLLGRLALEKMLIHGRLFSFEMFCDSYVEFADSAADVGLVAFLATDFVYDHAFETKGLVGI